MTNEEKAREIAKKVSVDYGYGLKCDSSIECYDAAMEMAAWKDEQFSKEVLKIKTKAVAVIKALDAVLAMRREMSRKFSGGFNPSADGMYNTKTK